MMGCAMGTMGTGWMALGATGMVVFWGSVIWLAVWAIRRFTGPAGNGFRTLEDRFARGEIDEHEFETRRRILER
jgi:putative membrane protein